MNTSTIRRGAALLCTLAVLVGGLAGCGGGDAGSPFPKELSFESLDGTPNQIFFAAAPTRTTGGIPQVSPLQYAVALYKVFQTDAEAAPIRAYMEDPNKFSPRSPPILFLTQPDYFTTRSVITFDLINLDARFTQFRLIRLVEFSDHIEMTLEACSTRRVIFENSAAALMGYFAIAKTSKPVTLLPLEFSPIPSGIQDVIGKCPGS